DLPGAAGRTSWAVQPEFAGLWARPHIRPVTVALLLTTYLRRILPQRPIFLAHQRATLHSNCTLRLRRWCGLSRNQRQSGTAPCPLRRSLLAPVPVESCRHFSALRIARLHHPLRSWSKSRADPVARCPWQPARVLRPPGWPYALHLRLY